MGADTLRAGSDGRVLLGTTPNGKEIYYARKVNSSLRFIEFGSGGQLPKQLKGGFGSVLAAKGATDAYLSQLNDKLIKEDGTEIKPKKTAKSK